MSFGLAGRFIGVIVFAVFCAFASSSFAVDKAGDQALSRALTQAKLFSGLTGAERDVLKAAATLRHGKAGERLIGQGKVLDRMFIILNGQAEVKINGKQVSSFSGQALVGEIEFLDKLPASADVLLLRDADLIELNCSALTNLMEKQPHMGYVLMREIAKVEGQRLRETNGK